jgi:peptidoglycan hydrolase-like protein with peptidoglycan-binding domain
MLSEGSDVKELQLFLNSNSSTQVAPSGIASPGQETEKFGYATQDAVKRFQTISGLDITGKVGLAERLTIKLLCKDIGQTKTSTENETTHTVEANQEVLISTSSQMFVWQTASAVPSAATTGLRSVNAVPMSTNVLAGYDLSEGGILQLTAGVDSPEYTQLALDTLRRIPQYVQGEYLTRLIITNTVPLETPNLLAAVTPIANDRFVLTIYKDNYLSEPEDEKALTIAHELSHIVAMNQTQHTEATTTCGTYVDINNNCYMSDSALHKFYQIFWNGLTGKQIFADSRYITPYAAESVSEDFAESFAYFTLQELYTFPQLSVSRIIQSPMVQRKLDFFNQFSEFVKLKSLILTGILR